MNTNYYSIIEGCRCCGSGNFRKVYRVPPIPIAGIYYDDASPPKDIKAPMSLLYCKSCGLLQLQETVSPEIYQDYSFIGNSTPSYSQYLEKVAIILVERFEIRDTSVFEVGASNGVLLKFLRQIGDNRVFGIEPSAKLCDDALKQDVNLQQGYFGRNFIERHQPGKYDCVIIRHVLEHIHDLADMMSSLKAVMSDSGILVIEVPSAEMILANRLFSNIFHEHLNYFSHSCLRYLLASHGLEPVHEEQVDIHGGSIFMICKGATGSTCRVGAGQLEGMGDFTAEAGDYYTEIHSRVESLLAMGKSVHGYGASHRTFVLMGNSNLGVHEIPIIYDNNAFLHRKRLNGLHSLVAPPQSIVSNRPDAIAILAISYEDEIINYLKCECGYEGKILSLKHEVLRGKH